MYDTYIPLLTYAHADGEAGSEIVPGLAESLPKITDGGKTYTLKLRKGLKYSDGTPVKASDFKASVERMFELNSSGSPYYTVIVGAEEFQKTKKGGISGIEADDKTGEIVIHLTAPQGAFNDLLALLFAAPVPADTPGRAGLEDPDSRHRPLRDRLARARARLVLRPQPAVGEDQRGARHRGPRRPRRQDRGEGRQQPVDPGQRSRAGPDRLDVRRRPARPRRRGESQIRGQPVPARAAAIGVDFVWMNTTQPPFDDLKVRQAVNYGVNPAQIERIYAGEITATHQIIPPGVPGYEEYDLYPFDMAKAQQLLKEANPSDLDVTFWTESLNEEAGEYFESMLDEIGFDAELKVVNSETYFTVIGNEKTPDLDLGFAGYAADYPDPNAFFEPLLSGASILPANNTNLSRIDDPALTEKIEKLATETLGPEQESEYAELDREFMELAPLGPLRNPGLLGLRLRATSTSTA